MSFDRDNAIPKSFTEYAVCTMYSEFFSITLTDKHVLKLLPLLLLINVFAYTNILAKATEILSIWDNIPKGINLTL